MTSAKPPVLENGRPSEATKRILTVWSCPDRTILLRYPTPRSASSPTHGNDSGGETSHSARTGRCATFACSPCLPEGEDKFHPCEAERRDGFPGSAGELSCRSI